LLLGQDLGWLQVFDIETSKITSVHKFLRAYDIHDIIAIDETHYLLAAEQGLFKTSKNQVINHYYKGKQVISLCHITD
jgi:hypothetical protein